MVTFYRRKQIFRCIAVLLCICFPGSLFGQDFASLWSEGVDEELFISFLDQADLSRDRDEWRRITHLGVEAVVARWEKEYFAAADMNTGISVNDIRAALGDVVEGRFLRFIVDDFFQGNLKPGTAELRETLQQASLDFLFETDPDSGAVLTDSGGALLLKKIDGAEEDRDRYRHRLSAAIGQLADQFSSGSSRRFGEIASLFSGDTRAEALIVYEASFSQYRDGYRREMEILAVVEERRFYARRIRDQYSLKNQSEEESAAEVAGRIIEDTRQELLEGLNIIEASFSVPGAIDAEKWRTEFRAVFEKGMEQWEKAEQEFLQERMLWEQRSLMVFQEGEALWKTGYDRLTLAGKAWEEELQSILESGLAAWGEKEAELSEAIRLAREELISGVEAQENALQQQADFIVQIYTDSLGMAKRAKECLKYWRKPANDTLTFIDSTGTARTYVAFWEDVERTNLRRMEETEKKLTALYSSVLSGKIERSPGFSDFPGGFGLDEQLNGDDPANWDQIVLDDWQIELLKAGIAREYWNNQYSIALAVYAYAADISSLRPTEGETLNRYEEAFAVWETEKMEYETLVSQLSDDAAALNAARREMTRTREELDSAAEKLAEAESVYEEAALLLETRGDSTFFISRISRYYQDLLTLSGCAAGESILNELASTSFQTADKYFTHRFFKNTAGRVRDLYHGTEGVGGIISLQTLRSRYESSGGWTFSADQNWEEQLVSMGIDQSHQLFPLLKDGWDKYAAIETGDVPANAPDGYKDACRFVEQLRIQAWMGRVDEINEQNYQRREMVLSLLTSPSFSSWLEKIGYASEELEQAFLEGGTEESFITSKDNTREGRFLHNRIETELTLITEAKLLLGGVIAGNVQVKDLWAEGVDITPGRGFLIEEMVLKGRDTGAIEETMQSWETMLKSFQQFFLSENQPGLRYDLQKRKEDFLKAAGASEASGQFAEGASLFYISDLQGTSSRSRDLLTAETFQQYKTAIPFLAHEIRAELVSEIEAAVEEHHLGSVRDIWDNRTGDIETLAALSRDLLILKDKLPTYAGNELNRFRYLFLQYGVTRAVEEGTDFGEVLEENTMQAFCRNEILEIRADVEKRQMDNQRNWRSSIGTDFQDTDSLPSHMYPAVWNSLYDHTLSDADRTVYTTIQAAFGEAESWYLNEILDVSIKLESAAKRFNNAVKVFGSAPQGYTFPNEYYGAFSSYFQHGTPISESAEEWEGFNGGPAAEEAFQAYNQQLLAENNLEALIAETGRLVYVLEHSQGMSVVRSELQEAGTVLDEMRQHYDDCTVSFSAVLKDYLKREEEYSGTYCMAVTSEEEYRKAGFLLDREEAVYTYASSAYADTTIPLKRLTRMAKNKTLAEAAYGALQKVGEAGPREDFALRDKEYQRAYQDFFNVGKDHRWLSVLSSFLAGEIKEQTERVEKAEETLDLHLKEIIDPVYQYSLEEDDVRSGLDPLGNPTEQFSAAQARDNYFYYGGTRTGLVKNEGFTIPQAEAEQTAYEDAAGNTSFKEDRSQWAADLHRYIQNKNLKGVDLFSFFQTFSMSVLYEESLAGEDAGISPLLIEPELFEEKMGSSDYSQLSTAFNTALLNAHTEITGDEKTSELFDFFYRTRSRGLVKNIVTPRGAETDVEGLTRDWILSTTVTGIDEDIVYAEKIFTGCMISYAAAFALAVAFSWVPGLGQFFLILAGYSLGLAGIHGGIVSEKQEFKEYLELTEKGTNTAEYIADLETYSGKLGTHAENVETLEQQESILSTMRGTREVSTRVTNEQLIEAIQEALSREGVSLGDYLKLKDDDLNGKSDRQFLAELIERYSERTGGENRMDTVELLSGMGRAAGFDKQKQAEGLQKAYLRLHSAQISREAAYEEILKRFSDHLSLYAYDPDTAKLIPVSEEEGETENMLLEQLNSAARSAFFEAPIVERTHAVRMVETGFCLAGYGDKLLGDERIVKPQLEEIGRTITSLNHDRLSAYRELKETEWAQMEHNVKEGRRSWLEIIEFTRYQGKREWNRAAAGIQSERQKWLARFQSSLEEKKSWWDLRYARFLGNKNQWIREIAAETASAGTARLHPLNQQEEEFVRDSASELTADMDLPSMEIAGTILRLTDNSFYRLLKRARTAGTGTARVDTKVHGFLNPSSFSMGNVMNLILQNQQVNREEIEEQVLLVAAKKALETIREAQENLDDQIERANEMVEESVDSVLRGSGYDKTGQGSGGVYHRATLVDSTLLGGNEYQTMSLDGYLYFTSPAGVVIDPGYKLAITSFQGKAVSVIELMVEKGFKAVEKVMNTIFGDGAEYEELVEGHRRETVQEEKSSTRRDREGNEHTSSWIEEQVIFIRKMYTVLSHSGLFHEHVGFAPELMDDDDIDSSFAEDPGQMVKNFKHAGKGELGRIIGEYLRQAFLQSRGIEEYRKPVYDRRMWDDDESNFLKAPTLRELADVAIGTAALFLGGGPLAAAALNLADDAFFTAADLGNGTDSKEVLLSFGKQVLTGTVTAALSAGSSLLEKSVEGISSVGGRIGGKTLSTLGFAGVRNISEGIINAFQFDETGRLSWENEVFIQSVTGDEALAGYAGAVIGGIAGNGIMEGVRGTIGSDYAHALSLAAIAETGMRAGIDYGITGKAVLSLAGVTRGQDHSGLFELHLGDEGVYGQLGREGYDVSASRVISAFQGIGVFGRNREITQAGYSGETASALRMLASLNKGKTDTLYENLISGDTNLVFDSGMEEKARTYRNETGATILLNNNLRDGNNLSLGIVLAHEAFRDGLAGNSNSGETIQAVLAHTITAELAASIYGNHLLDGTMQADIKALNLLRASRNEGQYMAYVDEHYDSSDDYWKIIHGTDGSLTMLDDGRDNVTILNEAAGTANLYTYSCGSKTQFIAESLTDYFGYEAVPRNQVLEGMRTAGWSYKSELGGAEKAAYLSSPTGFFNSSDTTQVVSLGTVSLQDHDKIAYQMGNSRAFPKQWGKGLWKGIASLFGLGGQAETYYQQGTLTWKEFGALAETQAVHTRPARFMEENWYTRGHPAVDLVGEGSMVFPENLDLIKTGRNNRRLLYQLSGKEDYLYFTHVDEEDVLALRKILQTSSTGRIFFESGSKLFEFPDTKDGNATAPVLHMELYRRRDDGTYWFGDPYTGEFLKDFRFEWSKTGGEYKEWIIKTPNKYIYWY